MGSEKALRSRFGLKVDSDGRCAGVLAYRSLGSPDEARLALSSLRALRVLCLSEPPPELTLVLELKRVFISLLGL